MKFLKYTVTVLLIIFIGLIIFWVSMESPPEWTGFGERTKNPKIEPAKTLFDWLKILILPLSLGLLGWLYKEDEKAKERKKESLKNKKEAYVSFVDSISGLIKDQGLSSETPSGETRAIALNKLSTALEDVDELIKGQIIQFLYQSNLIDHNPKLILVGANFSPVILDKIILVNSEIKGAYFQNSSFKEAKLNNGSFDSCNFQNSDFTGSHVKNADFSYTNLSDCLLKEMDLTTVNFEGADLTKADLKGSTIKQQQLDMIFKKDGIKLKKTTVI